MMLYADDEDASLKTPPVRPNDIIDIEVSPPGIFRPPSFKIGTELRTENNLYKGSPGKSCKIKGKVTKAGPPKTKKRPTDSMSRGDPFLSSVISDESPLSDYPIKNSRKKPSDCKCKGFGYNLSPSALLPEEMRQQWGVGVFGKPSTPSSRNGINQTSHSVISSLALCNGNSDNLGVQYATNNKTYQSPNQSHTFHHIQTLSPSISSARLSADPPKCQLCFQIPCMCYDFSHTGFRIPVKNDSRKIKPALRTTFSKIKESAIPVSLSCKNPSPVMKRIPCYSCKENSNIISTSNFSKTSTPSSMTLDRNYVSPSYDGGYFKTGFSCNRTPNRTRTNFTSVGASKSYTTSEFTGFTRASLTPKIRQCQLVRPPRRVMTNISAPTLMSREDPNTNHSVYDRSKPLYRSGSQMLVYGNGSHSCSCDTCRRGSSYMPRLETPEYPSNNNQQIVSPVVLSSSQKYRTGNAQSPLAVPVKRYHPYSGAPYAYTQTSRQLYQPPDTFSCPSPTFEYDSRRFQTPVVSSTPLSLAQDVSSFEASLSSLDNDIFLSPANSPGEVNNVLDMSIEETVDFFLNIKPPYIPPSSPLPSLEAQEDLIPNFYNSSFSMDDDLPSPTPQMKLSSFSYAPSTSQIPFQRLQQTDVTSTVQPLQPSQSQNRRKQSYPMSSHPLPLPSQSMSLLYSSLVSDFEDELRSAIENIPTD